MRNLYAAASIVLVAAGANAQPARSPYGLGVQFPRACAAGYHPDAGGNCQPDTPQYDRFCPPHTVYQPTFDGWDCNPAPPEAY